jgi:hypothetical protein
MKLFKKILLVTIFFLFLFLLFLCLKYIKWQKTFKSENTSLVCLSSFNEENFDIDEKIEKFIISDSKSEFIVFSREEIGSILINNIQNPESIEISDMCISTKQSMWTVYLKYRVGKINMPWILLHIAKDNRESAEIYIKDINLGNLKVPAFIRKNILVNINKGIADAIILVNENRFLGREIRNIELLEDKVVIKGIM